MAWRSAACLLFLLVAALLAGCTSPVPSAKTGAAASAVRTPPAPVPVETLTWSVWGNAWELDIDRRVAQLFEDENPGVHVEIAHKPWSEYFDWLKAERAQGRSPDVMFLNYIPMRAPDGMLENLDPYIARDRLDLSDFYPALIEQFKYQGRQYGLPRDNDTKVIYYNRDAFDQAGVPYPRDGWTWADLREAAIKLTRAQPVRYGFGFEAEHWWRLWVWQNGGDLVDDVYHPTRVTLNTPAAIEAIDYLAGLVSRDRVTPPPGELNTPTMEELFRGGRLAMMFGNHGEIPGLVENPELNWDVAPLPRGRQAVNFAGQTAGFMGVSYLLHKSGHHKLERMVPVANIASSAFAVAYGLSHR